MDSKEGLERLDKMIENQNKELADINKRLAETREVYNKQCRKNFIAGCFFLLTAIIFSIIGLVTNNSKLLLGIVLQLFAGTMLIIVNKS